MVLDITNPPHLCRSNPVHADVQLIASFNRIIQLLSSSRFCLFRGSNVWRQLEDLCLKVCEILLFLLLLLRISTCSDVAIEATSREQLEVVDLRFVVWKKLATLHIMVHVPILIPHSKIVGHLLPVFRHDLLCD